MPCVRKDSARCPSSWALRNIATRLDSRFVLKNLLAGAITPEDGLTASAATLWWTIGRKAVPLHLAFPVPAQWHTGSVEPTAPMRWAGTRPGGVVRAGILRHR
ncbi:MULTISPECIES: hypothetical protein [unclassified Streptomyces]|uniref:hypothetical protein n=1 Tax=unclassified Streptomyces TaxID=2593676 RepID=UPI00093BF7D3|nr:hypothetical protein [Streptomyces sp. TSRI0281]OKI44943.1 hypothetical protein A6A29_33455 [Streptomyces sp. TSRI0281]